MAVYRQVYITFWQDEFILELTPEEKYFYLYLMTNSKTSQCGIYQLPIKVMEMELGYNRDTIIKLIERFEQYGKIAYDESTKEVALVNWLKFNPINNINIQKCVEKELQGIKSDFLKEKYNPLISPLQTPCKKKEKEKTKEKEKEQTDKKKNKKKPADADFTSLFSSYTTNQELIEALNDFVTMRKGIKEPATQRAMKGILKKLDQLGRNDEEKIQILENAIIGNWRSVWPLNHQQRGNMNARPITTNGNYDSSGRKLL
ncbi:hypothetical protein GMB51_11825 [Turicibacter sanguinis]|nr:hypothetical protein [Turicibacter sanguinis]MTN51681.1 hypothetical protein [Turicibacter sanguinis]MTN53518.1 hypothetical protein [Turicibacter sanguinis]MTN57921.1 hypothetical protein [Turicibacter sanguinis]MTN61033.1 hypothetical protein [Turicibacter sanguinis]